MKTVISASRRTDIPAFYLNWFIEKIRHGYVEVQNPRFKKQFKRVDLNPDRVGWIVFWSRNYHQFLKNKDFFEDYKLFFHFTILSHHVLLEKHQLSQKQALAQLTQLVRHYGAASVIWRYDPIVVLKAANSVETNFDRENFRSLCLAFSAMGGKRCYFSFVTDYQKFKKRLAAKYHLLNLIHSTHQLYQDILSEMREIASAYNLMLYSCCNDSLIDKNSVSGHCISGGLLNQLAGVKEVSEAKAATRPDCGCTRSVDIGDYLTQPCTYGCIYCYANPVWR